MGVPTTGDELGPQSVKSIPDKQLVRKLLRKAKNWEQATKPNLYRHSLRNYSVLVNGRRLQLASEIDAAHN